MVTVVMVSLIVGIVAGLRAMLAPAAVSLATHLGVLSLRSTSLWFMGTPIAVVAFIVVALVELVTDKLPKTPSRKTPVQFGVRLVSGSFCGAAIGLANGEMLMGTIAGFSGAIIGTLAGAEARARLANAIHRDTPAALIEDAVAICGAAAAFVLVK